MPTIPRSRHTSRRSAATQLLAHVRTVFVGASLAVLLTGCAHHDARGRASRVLVGAGAAAIAVGALIAAGCATESGDDGCSGSGDDGDVEVGLPLMAAGAALVASGVAARPKDPGASRTRAVASPGPKRLSPGPRIELLRHGP